MEAAGGGPPRVGGCPPWVDGGCPPQVGGCPPWLEPFQGGTGKPFWKEEANGKCGALLRRLRHSTLNPFIIPTQMTVCSQMSCTSPFSCLHLSQVPTRAEGSSQIPQTQILSPRAVFQTGQEEGKRSGIPPNPRAIFSRILRALSHSTWFSCSLAEFQISELETPDPLPVPLPWDSSDLQCSTHPLLQE